MVVSECCWVKHPTAFLEKASRIRNFGFLVFKDKELKSCDRCFAGRRRDVGLMVSTFSSLAEMRRKASRHITRQNPGRQQISGIHDPHVAKCPI